MSLVSQPQDEELSRPPRGWNWIEIVLIVAVFYLSSPAPPPGVNEPHYLCRLRHAVDPSFCPGDPFLESPDAHFTFVLAFGWLTHWLPLETVAWIGRLGCWTAMAWAWLRLMWVIVPRPLFASLAAAIVVSAIAEGNFAGEWLVRGFEAKTVAYVFVILGLRAWLLNNWNRVWIFLGIASAWHALVGGWSVVILLALWGCGYRQQQPARAMLPGLLLGGLIALAGILPALALSRGVSPEVREEAAEVYVFERLPHHLAPLHKPAAWIAERAGRHATIVTLFFVLLLVRCQFVGGDWKSLRDDPAGRLAHFAVGAMGLAMIGLVLEVALWNDPSTAAGWLRYYWFRLTDVAVPIALAGLWIALLDELLRQRNKLAPVMLTIMLLLAGFPIAENYQAFLTNPVAQADRRARNVADWNDVCLWIREETARDAKFLTPRGNSSFKWHAERAEVVTYKDVPQDSASLVKWRRRLYDVFKPHGDPNAEWAGHLCELGTPRLRELADKYGADYVLTTHAHPLAFPLVYDNATYAVYAIPSLQNE